MTLRDRCWEIMECSNKESCPVFPHYGRSCWLIKGKLEPLFPARQSVKCHTDCESCEVYQWNMAVHGTKSPYASQEFDETKLFKPELPVGI
ncbi:MAG: hypothetical protein ACP5U1_06665 [Desulfomonilaceae bacterium]